MPEQPKSKGPLTHRILVFAFTGLLTLLLIWLLGFLLRDIGSLPAPDYARVEAEVVSTNLVAQERALSEQLEEISRQLRIQAGRQALLRDSTSSSQQTMNQLLEIQRLSLQQGVTLSDAERQALDESKQLFLDNQRTYQQLNEELSQLKDQEQELQAQRREIQEALQVEREQASREYRDLMRWHEIKIAALKLALLIPLIALTLYLYLKRRAGLYAPLLYAAAIALVWRVGLVLHEHFPARSFKYILIVASIATVGSILVYLLRAMAFPKKDWLLKQYKEAYARFVCPICSFPIRRGPLRFLFWTPRSIKRLGGQVQPTDTPDEPYSCPACGTVLFEKCSACGATRHALLPSCDKCGAAKPVESGGPVVR